MQRLQGQIDEIDRQIGAEVANIRASIKAQYDAAARAGIAAHVAHRRLEGRRARPAEPQHPVQHPQARGARPTASSTTACCSATRKSASPAASAPTTSPSSTAPTCRSTRHSPRLQPQSRGRPAARPVRRRAGRVPRAPPGSQHPLAEDARSADASSGAGRDPAPGRRHHAAAGIDRPALAVLRGLPLGAHGAAVRHHAWPAAHACWSPAPARARARPPARWNWRATSPSSASACCWSTPTCATRRCIACSTSANSVGLSNILAGAADVTSRRAGQPASRTSA